MPIVFGSPEAQRILSKDKASKSESNSNDYSPLPELLRRAYIARATCGCVYGVCTDDPRHPKDTARSVAEFIQQGLKVENVDWARYREISQEPTFFACPHTDPPADHPTLITNP
jgi:hypothetical protein